MPNRPRYTRPPAQGGVDAANAFATSRLMNNSFLTEILTGVTGAGILVRRALVENDSAVTVTLGMGARLAAAKWLHGSWTTATSTFAQSASQAVLTIGTTTANDGVLFICRESFSAILMTIGTVAVDAGGAGAITPVWELWTGSSFTTITPLALTDAGDFLASGRSEILFQPLATWVTATSAEITGLPSGSWFVLRLTFSDPPATSAAITTAVQVWDPMRLSSGQQAANTVVSLVDASLDGVLLTGDGEGLVVAISTADADNLVSVVGEYCGFAGVLGGIDGATFAAQT